MNNVSTGRDGTKDYWPETGARSSTGSQMAAVNVRTRLGVHPSTSMEHPHDDLRNTTAHPVDHNPQTLEDWKDWGRRAVLGIFDYFGEVVFPNNPPVINSFTPTDTTPEVSEGNSLEFTQTSSDPDNDTLTYSWLLDSVEQATTQNWTYSPDFDAAGTHNVTVVVSDGEMFDSQEWNVTVINVNRPPTIDSYYPPTDPTISEGESQEFNVTYSDLDGDPVFVQWYLNGTPTVTTDSYIFVANPGSEGKYNVTVTVSDGSMQTKHEWTLTVIGPGEQHDVAVIDVTTSKTGCVPMPTVGRGHTANVTVTVENQGGFAETFNVTAFANSSAIGEQQVTLNPGENKTLTFIWDTTGFSYGNYAIKAVADTVPGETDTIDNTYIDGVVKVVIPGDVDGDGRVNILDAIKLAGAFGSKQGDGNWNPNADINGDGRVNILDAIMLAGHFGEINP